MDNLLKKKFTVSKYTMDMGVGVVTMALGLFLLFVGVPKFIAVGLSVMTATFTPQSFPRFVSIMFVILGAIVFGTAVINKKEAVKAGKEIPCIEFYIISFAVVALVAFFALTIKLLGYPVTNIIIMLAMYYLSGGKKLWVGILMSILFTIVSTWFFAIYLKLSMPLGVFEFILH